jgi:hypothetical protein
MRLFAVPALTVCVLCAFTVEAFSAQTTLAVTQVWQHKDTGMRCALPNIPGLPASKAHSWNCATANSCPYCEAYCGPAAASMIGLFKGQAAPFVDIDNIHDNAKAVGEIMGNGILETHGVPSRVCTPTSSAPISVFELEGEGRDALALRIPAQFGIPNSQRATEPGRSDAGVFTP